jgi:omega-6 fatty acid desaturase (delta-12 desaturase)
MCINPFLSYPKKHFDCLLALLIHIAIGVGLYLYGGVLAVIFGQTIPHVLISMIGSYLFYAQHNFPGVSFEDRGGWTYEKAALESSSYLKTSRVVAWFTGNIGYHHVHHLNARIPFYRLPETMNALPELRNPRQTNLRPKEILRCLRLKVWDVETQKLIPLSKVFATPLVETTNPSSH